MKWIGAGLIGLGIVGGIFFLLLQKADPKELLTFAEMYEKYEQASLQQRDLVSRPGTANNPHRNRLHTLLGMMLTGDIDDATRLALADEANNRIAALRKEIDMAASTIEPIEELLQDFKREQEFITSRAYQEPIRQVLAHMQQKQVLVESTVTTLYAINEQTRGIVEQIIKGKGALTDEHIVQINQETSDAETRYERLTQLYKEMEEVDEKIQEEYQILVGI